MLTEFNEAWLLSNQVGNQPDFHFAVFASGDYHFAIEVHVRDIHIVSSFNIRQYFSALHLPEVKVAFCIYSCAKHFLESSECSELFTEREPHQWFFLVPSPD